MPDGGRCLKVYVPKEGQRDHLVNLRGQDLRRDSSIVRWFTDDEQGGRPTPFSLYWIDGSSIHQSDQLEEAGRCGWRDFKKARTDRVRVVITWDFLRSKAREDFWYNRGQRVGQYFAIDLWTPACCHTGSDAGLRSVSIKTALSFHPALPPQNSFVTILHQPLMKTAQNTFISVLEVTCL